MATFNVYTDLIEALGEALLSDPKFEGIAIFYDRTSERQPSRDDMPAINYFLEAPAEDVGRGSGQYSLQVRHISILLGFGVWISGGDPGKLDQGLWEITGNLLDWFRDHIDFNRTLGIGVDPDVPIRIDFDYSGDTTNVVGSHRLVVGFRLFGGSGPKG